MSVELDAYILTRHRDAATIGRFLDGYIDRLANEDRADEDLLMETLPIASGATDQPVTYEWEPALTLSHSVQRGLDYPRRAFPLYLRPKNPAIDTVIVGFTRDDLLVLGLTILEERLDAADDTAERQARQLVHELARDYEGYLGVVLVDDPPPLSEADFRAKAQHSPRTLYNEEFSA
jgi:hypothetical protein